jgi:hypothetical protein
MPLLTRRLTLTDATGTTWTYTWTDGTSTSARRLVRFRSAVDGAPTAAEVAAVRLVEALDNLHAALCLPTWTVRADRGDGTP